MQQGEPSDPTNKETRVIWAVCSSTRENLNWYSFRANHDLRSPESRFSDNLNNQQGLRWKPQRLPNWKQHSITNLPDFADKWPHYSQPFHRIGANCTFLDWDTFLTRPQSHVCASVSRLLERFAQHSAKDQKRNNEWVRVSEHSRPESVQNTHSLYNLVVSSPTKPRLYKQPEQESPSQVVEGSGQFVTHPLPSLPPHHYSPIIQVPYEAVNRGGIITLRRHPKMGWNRRLQWNQLSASTPKKSPRDTEGQKASTFLQTFSTSSPLSFLFNPQPFYTIVLIFIVGWAIFFPLTFLAKYTMLKNCWLHLGLLMWIQQRKEATESFYPTRHMHTQKEIAKNLTSKLCEPRK